MSGKPVVPRALATRDIDEAVADYVAEGAEQAPRAFIDALERAFIRLGRHPGIGSPRYAHELNLPGLRCAAVSRYPHLIFYVERDHDVDVWRVLHGERDLAPWLRQGEDP